MTRPALLGLYYAHDHDRVPCDVDDNDVSPNRTLKKQTREQEGPCGSFCAIADTHPHPIRNANQRI